MKNLFNKTTKLSFVLSFMVLIASTAVYAIGEPGINVNSGVLSGGTITYGNFNAVNLDGTAKTTQATWSISDVTDATGIGAGWELRVTLSQFKEYGALGYVTGGKTLPKGSLKIITPPVVSKKDATSSDLSTITTVLTNTLLDTEVAVPLIVASVNGGMGSYTVSDFIVELTLPADTYARTYKTEAIEELVTGP
jgi:hypothetical protein